MIKVLIADDDKLSRKLLQNTLEKAGYEFECRMRKSITKDGETIDEFIYAIVRV